MLVGGATTAKAPSDPDELLTSNGVTALGDPTDKSDTLATDMLVGGAPGAWDPHCSLPSFPPLIFLVGGATAAKAPSDPDELLTSNGVTALGDPTDKSDTLATDMLVGGATAAKAPSDPDELLTSNGVTALG